MTPTTTPSGWTLTFSGWRLPLSSTDSRDACGQIVARRDGSNPQFIAVRKSGESLDVAAARLVEQLPI